MEHDLTKNLLPAKDPESPWEEEEEPVLPSRGCWCLSVSLGWLFASTIFMYVMDVPTTAYTREQRADLLVFTLAGWGLTLLILPMLHLFGPTLYGVYFTGSAWVFTFFRLCYQVFYATLETDIFRAHYGKGATHDHFKYLFMMDILYALLWPLYSLTSLADIIMVLVVMCIKEVIGLNN